MAVGPAAGSRVAILFAILDVKDVGLVNVDSQRGVRREG